MWNSLAWHERWLGGAEPKAYHYFNTKPWSMSPAKYPDLKIWYSGASDCLKTYPGKFEGYHIQGFALNFYSQPCDDLACICMQVWSPCSKDALVTQNTWLNMKKWLLQVTFDISLMAIDVKK